MTATLVRITLHRPGPLGDTVPASGYIECTPTRRRHIEGGDPEDYIVLPAKFSAKLGAALLDEDGETVLQPATPGVAWATLEPTDAGPYANQFAWRFTERTSNGKTRYCFVPTDAGTVDYGDLVDIDPTTFDPDPDAIPAWTTQLAAEVEAREDADDVLAAAIAAVEAGDVDSVNGVTGAVVAAVVESPPSSGFFELTVGN